MQKEFEDIKLNKSSFSVSSLSDQTNDKDFWLKTGPNERLRHIELLRKINYGHRASARLQRFFEVAER